MKILCIQIQDKAPIEIELFEAVAPLAISGIEKIIQLGKYNQKRIERFEPGFVIQPLFFDGLDEDIDQMIPLEVSSIPFERYTVGMAGDGIHSSGSQFFITLQETQKLNHHFTVVGRVISGFSTIEWIEAQETIKQQDSMANFYHCPKKDIQIEQVYMKERD